MLIRMTLIRDVAVPTPEELEAARRAVGRHLRPTPLVPVPWLGDDVSLKLETLQPTGSFKVRGALAALAGRDLGGSVVAASAGNHGLAVAWAARRLGVRARIVVPETASAAKLDGLRRDGADVVLHGRDVGAAEAHALGLAVGGPRYLSPYNDTDVIAGGATVGDELAAACERPLLVVVPVSGGGLISGIGLWARQRGAVRVVGVEAAASRQMSAAVAAGGEVVAVDVARTVADGLAGNLEPGSITPRIVAETVEEIVAVTEDELRAGMRLLALRAGVVAEGAGAAADGGDPGRTRHSATPRDDGRARQRSQRHRPHAGRGSGLTPLVLQPRRRPPAPP